MDKRRRVIDYFGDEIFHFWVLLLITPKGRISDFSINSYQIPVVSFIR